jgi:signal recognition particle subunit SRP54
VVLTKMDGDARGGAALSIRAVTGAPVKYVGVGEKLSDLEEFHPDRVAGRILGMGDVLTLVEKAQTLATQEEAEELARKMQKARFTLEDFRVQMRRVKQMGSLESILKMIPGMGALRDKLAQATPPEKEMERTEAIINSMTMQERNNPDILNGSRRARIAKGSGTTVQEVNKLLHGFEQMRRMMKDVMGGKAPGGGRLPPGMGGMPGMGAMPGMSMPGGAGGGSSAAKKRKKREQRKRKKKK